MLIKLDLLRNRRKTTDDGIDPLSRFCSILSATRFEELPIYIGLMAVAGEPGEGEEIVLINLVIYKASDRTTMFNEGCLSFPGIFADVEGILFFDRMTTNVLETIRSDLQVKKMLGRRVKLICVDVGQES
ncbi:peptide deformylase 1B [Carex littledalei]|uniref:peptide deformylase n=1 Tax=Carex littledalei TaxID=544730 RepID=A0A833R5X2_9POAL|nr:peptide deformylase 1B [Carex littledalei]